jgi:dihydroorotate dehydrogenase (NAD+) catalytic subunit
MSDQETPDQEIPARKMPARKIPDVSNSIDLTTSLGSLQLQAPTATASGCAAAGRELAQFGDVRTLGSVVTKSIMKNPRSGRPTPRMAETPSGMLNSIGLQGPGIEAFLEKDLSWLTENGVTTIVSIAGNNVDEFGELANRLKDVPGIAALEVNISCPNVESRGQVFACNPFSAASVIAKVERDALMTVLHEQFPHYGWSGNKGYGAAVHTDAIKIHGVTDLHRKSWNLGI